MIHNQDRNGVRVRVDKADGGSVVDAQCSCLGIIGRVHSDTRCPLLTDCHICGGAHSPIVHDDYTDDDKELQAYCAEKGHAWVIGGYCLSCNMDEDDWNAQQATKSG